MTPNHSVIIPTGKSNFLDANNRPVPTGTLTDPSQPGPSPVNKLQCSYPCSQAGHTDTVQLLWDGTYFSLPADKANDPNFGTVSFSYDPPLQ